jgi:hypothetical protein
MRVTLLILVLVFSCKLTAQKVGVNTTDPKVELDINGMIRFRPIQINAISSTGTFIPNMPGCSYWVLTGAPPNNIPLYLPNSERGSLIIIENSTSKIAFINNLPVGYNNILPKESIILYNRGGYDWKRINESQLAKIRNQNQTGYRLRTGSYFYTGIGEQAVDLSNAGSVGPTTGAVGINSFASGFKTIALFNGTALGHLTQADQASTAIGNESLAIYYSTALGRRSYTFNYGVSMGDSSLADGYNSTAMGYKSETQGPNSTAMGYNSYSFGETTTSLGSSRAISFYSTSIGKNNTFGISGGTNTWISTDPLFYIGNCEGLLDTGTAWSIYKNGDTDINGKLKVKSNAGLNNKITVTGVTNLNNKTIISPNFSIIDPDTIIDKIAVGRIADGTGWDVGLGIGGNYDNTWGIGSEGGSLYFGLGNTTANSLQTGIEINQNRNIFLAPFSGGNVGIGTTNANGRLQFANELNKRKIVLKDSLINNHQFYGIGIDTSTMTYQVPAIGSAHRFYVGTSATTSLLLFSIFGNGNATLTGFLTQNSDKKLKKNISPITNALSSLCHLNGYTYRWISEHKDTMLQSGLIAQEVETVLPHLTSKQDDGMLSVNYVGLIPYMIEGIKTLKKESDDHKVKTNKDIKDIKARLDKLEALLSQ